MAETWPEPVKSGLETVDLHLFPSISFDVRPVKEKDLAKMVEGKGLKEAVDENAADEECVFSSNQ